MRIKFSGPEGAAFAGQEFPAVQMDDAPLEAIASLQRATKLKMQDLITQAEENEAFGIQVGLYLALHDVGHLISWEKAKSFRTSEFEWVEEPGDAVEVEADSTAEGDAEGADADPTTPSMVSVPAAVDGQPTAD